MGGTPASASQDDNVLAVATAEFGALERRLRDLETHRSATRPLWPSLLATAGLGMMVLFGRHAYAAYSVVERIDHASGVETPNALALFGDLTTNGIQVGGSIDARSRQAYAAALEQFVLDGTAGMLGLVLVVAALYVAYETAEVRPRRSATKESRVSSR